VVFEISFVPGWWHKGENSDRDVRLLDEIWVKCTRKDTT
jgi:hypothetical protein